jgi:hypothetical protein
MFVIVFYINFVFHIPLKLFPTYLNNYIVRVEFISTRKNKAVDLIQTHLRSTIIK